MQGALATRRKDFLVDIANIRFLSIAQDPPDHAGATGFVPPDARRIMVGRCGCRLIGIAVAALFPPEPVYDLQPLPHEPSS
jgi:hypothetical protein